MSGCKINAVAFGLAMGILWGISVLIVGLVAHYYAYGHDLVISMGNLVPGYYPSIQGSILGGVMSFIDAFIMGFIFAWLYNKLCGCGCQCCEPKEKVVRKTRKSAE